MDTYRDSEPGIGKIWTSDYAAGIYKIDLGKDVPNPDGTRTITGTLDERHRDTNDSGCLSYSMGGKLMYTPLTYSSDELSIPSFADEDSQK